MGWYHVRQEGKGIEIKDLELKNLNFDMINDIIKDRNVIDNFFGRSLDNYDLLTTRNKWVLIGLCLEGYWPFLLKKEENKITNKDIEDYFDEDDIIDNITESLSAVFSIKYGYPLDAFRSCRDYDRTFMFFCKLKYPPKDYNEPLASLTESKYLKQLQEFLYEFTSDEYYLDCPLEMCEEYIKE